MRRRAFPVIVGATVTILVILLVFIVFGLARWAPMLSTPGFGSPLPPPAIPTAMVDGEAAQSGESAPNPLDLAAIEEAWVNLSEVAQTGNWTPWARVVDADTGAVVFAANDSIGHTPASTMKVLTAYFALSVLPPDMVLTTGVSRTDATLYLWGEGDLLLSAGTGNPDSVVGHAGLDDLAQDTAEALRADGLTTVTLTYQGELFDGPVRPPGWEEQEVTDFGGDVGAFAIDTGRTSPGAWQFVEDSAAQVADTFAESLRSRGITVQAITPGQPPKDASEVATVHSATVLDQIDFMATTSDNTLAEQYCHLAASSYLGASATLAESTRALSSYLDDQRISTDGFTPYDCSGLDSRTKVAPQTLTDTILSSASPTVASGSLTRFFPVGGFTGTLTDRFDTGSASGNVAAKTGSLGAVATLAGVVTNQSGQTLIFAVGADDVPDDGAGWYRPTLDAFVTALADS